MQRLKSTGSHHNRPKSGRPAKLSTRDRRLVLRYVAANKWKPWQSVSELLAARGLNVKPTLIRTVASHNGIRRYIARSRPALTRAALIRRIHWARSNKQTDWRHIIYTDECSFDTSNLKRKPHVSRRAGTATVPENTARSFHNSRKTVMVWAAITYGKKSKLIRMSGTGQKRVTSKVYIDKILNGALREFVLQCELDQFTSYSVVEDNAAIHNSRAANDARAAAGILRQGHPPLSPDLNPIEKAWRLLKSRLRARNLSGATPDQVWEAAQEEWDRIDPEHINKYMDDMPRRVKLCIKRHGRFTE